MPYMDQTQQNNIQILLQFQKKPIQILLSISALSMLLSLSPIFPMFSNIIRFINTFSSQIFAFATDRTCIFLFCNGILAFLIKNSSTDHSDQDHLEKIFDYHISGPEVAHESKRELVGEEVVEFKEEKAKENDVFTSQDQSSEEKEEDVFIVSEEEEEEERMGLMSAEEIEELNKKFEEFIRKMREGIREGIKLEAQTRLIMACY